MTIELDEEFCAIEGSDAIDAYDRIIRCAHCGDPAPVDEREVSGYLSLGEGMYVCPKVRCLQAALRNVRDERDQWRREAMEW